MKTYPDTASGSVVVLRFMSMNVCATKAPLWGLLPFATNSSALTFVVLALFRSTAMTTSDGRLN